MTRFWLQVLVQNDPAIRLYEKLGYEHVRELELWALDRLDDERRQRTPLAVEDALGRVADRLPWQRADETVANLDDAQALTTNGGTLIYPRLQERHRCCKSPPNTKMLCASCSRLFPLTRRPSVTSTARPAIR